MHDMTECRHMFSNGSEYEWFLENQCYLCALFKKGHCRTFRMLEKARWDERFFPYSELMNYKGYGGKACKRFTTEKRHVVRTVKQIDGQMELPKQPEEVSGDV